MYNVDVERSIWAQSAPLGMSGIFFWCCKLQLSRILTDAAPFQPVSVAFPEPPGVGAVSVAPDEGMYFVLLKEHEAGSSP